MDQTSPKRQAVLTVNFAGIPEAMQTRNQWVVWRREERDGKEAKVPYQPSGQRASPTDPTTWSAFDAVQHAYQGGGFDGVGFVVSAQDDFVFVDLDGCRNPETGEPREWSPELLKQAPGLAVPIDIILSLNSYIGLSPSGTGFHLFCRGRLPPGRRRIGGKGSGCPDGIEMYDKGRYATVTGHVPPGWPTEPRQCTEELTQLHGGAFSQKIEPEQASKAEPGDHLSDAEIIERAGKAANGDQFRRLWSGDHSSYPSPSEADLALAGMLAFWTGRHPSAIERLMRQSGLVREKWERDDYLQATIRKAMDSKTEFCAGSASLAPTPSTPLPEPRRDFPLTDSGNAERFTNQHGGDVRHVHQWAKWLVWDGKRWSIDAMAAVERLTKATVRRMYREAGEIEDAMLRKEVAAYARKCESADRRAAMLRLARSELPLPIGPAILDTYPWLLNCENGTLDLRTGDLREHRREDFLTKLAPVVYDASEDAPKWRSFLDRIFDGSAEVIGFLQRLLGYCLTGNVGEHVLPILYGTGANGKSTLIEQPLP